MLRGAFMYLLFMSGAFYPATLIMTSMKSYSSRGVVFPDDQQSQVDPLQSYPDDFQQQQELMPQDNGNSELMERQGNAIPIQYPQQFQQQYPLQGQQQFPQQTQPQYPQYPAVGRQNVANAIPVQVNSVPRVTNTAQTIRPPLLGGQNCICVPNGQCTQGVPQGNSPDGSGVIDVRIITNPLAATQNRCQAGLMICCLPGAFQCGKRYTPIPGSPIPGPGQAAYGAYPWQVALLGGPTEVYVGSGALINTLNVLTAAHRVANYVTAPATLKARLGEWNAAGATEPYKAEDHVISQIIMHPAYNKANLKNDVAILRLGIPVVLGTTPTISTACLPSATVPGIGASNFAGSRCWVSGWGKSDFINGPYQAIQKAIDVPVLQPALCQRELANTRLGPSFQFDSNSFICAGGEAGKDACTGDGGSPLVCQLGDRWYVAGLVAWGIGCGVTNVPGVYVNVQSYVPWINQVAPN